METNKEDGYSLLPIGTTGEIYTKAIRLSDEIENMVKNLTNKPNFFKDGVLHERPWQKIDFGIFEDLPERTLEPIFKQKL